MMKKIFSRYLAISGSLVFLIGTIYLFACGPELLPGFFRMFNPEIIRTDTYRPFNRAITALYGQDPYAVYADGDSINATEWMRFLKSKLSYDEMKHLLYEARIGEVDTIIYCLKSNSFSASKYLKSKAAALGNDKSAAEFLYYLGYAKRCQIVAAYVPNWYENYNLDSLAIYRKNPRNNRKLMDSLLAGGTKMLQYAKTDFIRQRYLFQLVRLYYYGRQFDKCIALYDEHGKSFDEGLTKYRIMGYAAGAHYGMKHFATANYLFSLIYDKCEPLRISAYASFKPVEEADWNQSLALARSDREREVLWQLLGIYKDPLRAMQQIYAINPKSDLLNVLLVRFINTTEENVWSMEEEEPDVRNTYSPKPGMVPTAALSFITGTAKAGNTHNPELWNTAAAYMLTMSGRHAESIELINNLLASGTNNPEVLMQWKVTKLISVIDSAPKIDAALESQIINDMRYVDEHIVYTSYYGAAEWLKERLAERYRKQGDVVKSELLHPLSVEFYKSPANTSAMVAFMDKSVKTSYDTFLLRQYELERQSIYDHLAVRAFFTGDIKEALHLYAEGIAAASVQVPPKARQEYYGMSSSYITGETTLNGDPFVIHINDCHDCDHAAPKKTVYTKISFMKKMLELRNLADTDAAHHVKECFELANGYYNASYWGNARKFYETDIQTHGFIGFESYSSTAGQHEEYLAGLRAMPVFALDKAGYYYKRAMDNSTDREFKAKCAFMLAKCEHNTFILSKPFNYAGDFKAGEYFRLLKQSYADTKYYREIIKECGYFRTFASAKK